MSAEGAMALGQRSAGIMLWLRGAKKPITGASAVPPMGRATAKTRRVAILGDMRELGDQGESLHRQVGAYAAKTGVQLLILAGEYAKSMAAGAEEAGCICPIFCFPDRDALETALPNLLQDGDTVLIKASRGLEFEHTVELLQNI